MGILDRLTRRSIPVARTERVEPVIGELLPAASEARAVSSDRADGDALIQRILSTWYHRQAVPRRGTRELLQAYTRSPHLRSVVSRVAVSCASPRWRVYTSRKGKLARQYDADFAVRRDLVRDGLAKEELTEVPNHPLARLLAQPNPEMAGVACRRLEQVYLDLKGEAFWILDRLDAKGAPTEMWPIPPHWVHRLPSATGNVGDVWSDSYEVAWNGARVQIPRSQMLYLKEMDPVDPYLRGTGIGESLGDELDSDEYAAKHVKAWFANHCVPSHLIGIDAGRPELAIARQEWEERNKGVGRNGRVHFHNDPSLTVQRLDDNFKDMELVDMREFLAAVVRETYNVPPEVVGHMDNSNRATAEAAMWMLGALVVQPRLEFRRSEYMQKLVPLFGDSAQLVLEYDDPVPPDRQARLDAMRAAPWAASKNEWRTAMGLPPREGDDEVFFEAGSIVDLKDGRPEPEPAPEVAPPKGKPGADKDEEKEEKARAITRSLSDDDIGEIILSIDPIELDFGTAPLMREVVENFGRGMAAEVGIGASFNMLDPAVVEHLAEFSSTRIKMINDTTRDQVRAELIQGVAQGEGSAALGRRVRGVVDEAYNGRSYAIARTEVIRSSNFARLEALEMAGEDVVPGKQWLATIDGRERSAHRALNGQVRKVKEPFTDPHGHKAQHPGAFGIAKDDIQCRCTLIPVLDMPEDGDRAVTAEQEETLWRAYDRTAASFEGALIAALQHAFRQQEIACLRTLERLAR